MTLAQRILVGVVIVLLIGCVLSMAAMLTFLGISQLYELTRGP